jgi:hypothetical protein
MKRSSISTTLLAVMILVLGLWIVIYVSKPVGIWIYLLIPLLCLAFLDEATKYIKGQKGFWEFLSPLDKFITFIDMVFLFLFGIFPMEIGISLGVVPIFVLFGYTLVWFFTKKFGSEFLQENILWPKP